MRRRTRPRVPDAEPTLNALLAEYEATPVKGWRYAVRHPRRAARMLSTAAAVPLVHVRPQDDAEGRAVHRELTRGRPMTPLHSVSAALAVPADLARFTDGASMQTLRRKVRAAERRGITWGFVTDEAERRCLIAAADAHERERAVDADCCDPSNDDLLDYGLWLVARDAAGTALLLSVTPVAGDTAALRFFRTLVAGDDATLARYLMTLRLVEQLHALGVRRLVDTTISLHLSNGLRHFQRMVGFRLVRLRVARPAAAGGPVAQEAATPARELVGR